MEENKQITEENVQAVENEKQPAQLTKEMIERIKSIPNRQKVSTDIDKALGGLGYNFYEILLGLCDFATTILTLELSNALETKEEKDASVKRVNDIREKMCDVLNERTAKYLAEEMVASLSLFCESVVIGLDRELQASNDNKE